MEKHNHRKKAAWVVEVEVVEPGGELPDRAYSALADIVIEFARQCVADNSNSTLADAQSPDESGGAP